ncbi:AraC family transcriptional regulator [Nocardia cyriacigeorgica]|uniref:AraC family transcriptional regulator n=2 Tax=Nocardia cyriacigeorgica TaxID=135487 RepID=A0A6P1CN32_9NOCA|nr:AraC family transcriptional regulator ligand-binding domain-containing protein [Nocardia cyriacigeorgica]NEW32754.1 AraC family transcriptional regulator [Nocardia cyriacigeorgica]PPJ02517.1 AraC family transcriptional regulator [Nocardia cyriacigeorgica]BDT87360.1 transcriptional regulator [Nocardia cyriacigeorgica]CCF63718.1 putative transcriptional regulator [Nocardia cyriacigeorgica GUH-2]
MPTDNVAIHRFIIGELRAAGIGRKDLVGEIGLPPWALATDDIQVPSRTLVRLWEVAEHDLGDPDIAIALARRFRLKTLGLYDYLFATSPTLAAALATSEQHLTAVTTNHHCRVVTDNTGEVTLYLEMVEGDGRGRDHTQLWILVGALTRARQVLDASINPVRVMLRQAPPRHIEAYTSVFGSAALEFSAPYDAITFRAADAHSPLKTSDPALAAVLRPLADSLPPPPQPPTTWRDRVAVALSEALDDGDVSLDIVARRLMTSPRTLQRRLQEAGTTWRNELDRARAARLVSARSSHLTRERQAQLLAYSSPTSIRRATRRWTSPNTR